LPPATLVSRGRNGDKSLYSHFPTGPYHWSNIGQLRHNFTHPRIPSSNKSSSPHTCYIVRRAGRPKKARFSRRAMAFDGAFRRWAIGGQFQVSCNWISPSSDGHSPSSLMTPGITRIMKLIPHNYYALPDTMNKDNRLIVSQYKYLFKCISWFYELLMNSQQQHD
jgi:hypothetical protein